MTDDKVDIPEENDNEVGGEDNGEEKLYVVDNPSLDLEVGCEAPDVFKFLSILTTSR